MTNDVTSSLKNRGILGWFVSFLLITFYIFLYWGEHLVKVGIPAPQVLDFMVKPVEWLATLLRAKELQPYEKKWFLYGFLYTAFVIGMGIRFMLRLKDNKYQIYRTASVMFVQLMLAFMLPHLMVAFDGPEFYFSYFWPLKQAYFFPKTLNDLHHAFFVYSAIMSFVAVPVLTYYFGKRWYCSWVCGCGALAETAGDPFRHLSDKSSNAWKLEKVSIYTVLGLVILTTIFLWIAWAFDVSQGFKDFANKVEKWYGFFIASGLAGVIGTGFYPIGGSRVWCRFGCPQAAILGIFQVLFSRFRITTNGDQCMSCGNCSTYCEMGIDVRMYAMQGKDILRASCVGCGMCAMVCPRGVLKLENGQKGVKL